jgi:Glycosyltransferases, probably involved in cell wall biogenesis
MISVIVQGRAEARELAALLAALVPAAVDGLVREVIVIDDDPADATAAICEDAGAAVTADLQTATKQAKADLLLLLPTHLRLRPGWDESLRRHIERGGEGALVCEADAGLLSRLIPPRTAGVLVDRRRVGEASRRIEDVRRTLGRSVRLS